MPTSDGGARRADEPDPERKHAPDSNWLAVWAGAVAALVTVVLVPRIGWLAEFGPTLAPLIPAAASLIVAVLARLWHPPRAADLLIISVSMVVLVALVGIPVVTLNVVRTAPGRGARSAATSWNTVADLRFGDRPGCTALPEDTHGTGLWCVRAGAARLQLRMKGVDSASQESTALTPAVSGEWYAEVRLRRADGPAGTVCALLLGHLAENRFYALRVQGATLQLTHYTGSGAARSLFQAALPPDVKIDKWTRLGTRLDGATATFFVNDRRVGDTVIDPPPDGSVDLATILPRGDRPYQAGCAFDDLLVAQRPD